MPTTTILRARVAHTPRDPFRHDGALETFDDGAVAFAEGAILAAGPFAEVAAQHPGAEVLDRRDCILLPGFVDTHVHYPQIAVIGAMGLQLLDWLATRTLPEEAKMADAGHARRTAQRFVRALAANGTTSALVFGSHFPSAQQALFEEAEAAGLRIASGLVVSDRNLLPSLEVTPEAAYEAGRELRDRWHGRGRLRYAVTPRFSVSCSEPMLDACRALLDEAPTALFTSHVNESPGEIDFVRELFPDARDYVGTYEDAGLLRECSVLAHNVHVSDGELERLASARTAIAHCPSSNAFLASGRFPLARHLEHGVRVGMGTDVGAGTGLSMLKEGLVAYHTHDHMLGPAHLLWLATAAGAGALGLGRRLRGSDGGEGRGPRAAAAARRVDFGGGAGRRAVVGGRAGRGVHVGAGGVCGRGAGRWGRGVRAGRRGVLGERRQVREVVTSACDISVAG